MSVDDLPVVRAVRRPAPWAGAGAPAKAAQSVRVVAPDLVLDAPGLIVDDVTGEAIAGYVPGQFDAAALLPLLHDLRPFDPRPRLNYRVSPNGDGSPSGRARLSGIAVPSLTFGASPAVAARRRYAAQLSASNFTYADAWARLSATAAGLYGRLLASSTLPFGDTEGVIAPAWKVAGTSFTSAIVNFPGAAYPFHRDSGNLPGSWSLQLNLRGRFSSGGVLVLPEYGVGLACASGSVCVFPGGGLWHGVTGIGGMRMSVVFYAKAGLRHAAATIEEELAAGNARRTAYERAGATSA